MKSKKREFLEILAAYQCIVHKVCLVYFRNEADRKDNFQEIVYQLWKSYPKLKNKNSIGSWIYAVSINTSISKIRKESRMYYRETLPEVAGFDDTFDKMSKLEDTELLLKAIQNLSEIDKSIMLLYLEEKTYHEIAEITGITRTNVGVKINRAKKELKKNLNFMHHGK